MLTLGRIVQQSDALIRDQLGRELGGPQLRQLATAVLQQRTQVATLSDSAISAVRLATRNLAQALARVQATAGPAERADDDEQAAAELLGALRELERSIVLAQRRMHDAGASIAHIAERAGRANAAVVCAGLIARLVRRGPARPEPG